MTRPRRPVRMLVPCPSVFQAVLGGTHAAGPMSGPLAARPEPHCRALRDQGCRKMHRSSTVSGRCTMRQRWPGGATLAVGVGRVSKECHDAWCLLASAEGAGECHHCEESFRRGVGAGGGGGIYEPYSAGRSSMHAPVRSAYYSVALVFWRAAASSRCCPPPSSGAVLCSTVAVFALLWTTRSCHLDHARMVRLYDLRCGYCVEQSYARLRRGASAEAVLCAAACRAQHGAAPGCGSVNDPAQCMRCTQPKVQHAGMMTRAQDSMCCVLCMLSSEPAGLCRPVRRCGCAERFRTCVW